MGGGGLPATPHRSRAGSGLSGESSREAGDEVPLCIIKVAEGQQDVFLIFQRPQLARDRKDELLTSG